MANLWVASSKFRKIVNSFAEKLEGKEPSRTRAESEWIILKIKTMQPHHVLFTEKDGIITWPSININEVLEKRFLVNFSIIPYLPSHRKTYSFYIRWECLVCTPGSPKNTFISMEMRMYSNYVCLVWFFYN